jgi:NAD-dependent dihydropyrimidine dehydrogenase PreA subunit
MLTFSRAFTFDQNSKQRLGIVLVIPDAVRCMQCGICSYNCPAGIDVRTYAWRGLPIDNDDCLLCGQCVSRCLRRALHFEPLEILTEIKA